MGTSRIDYPGYCINWVTRADCRSSRRLHSLGVHGTVRQVMAVLEGCGCGWITTGGCGHVQHLRVYSLHKLKSLFPKE